MEKCEWYKKVGNLDGCTWVDKFSNCNGDMNKCDYFPKKQKNTKINTAEMWLQAQKTKKCYKMIEQTPDLITIYYQKDNLITIYYQKDKGFFDSNNNNCDTCLWNYIEDLMNEKWEVCENIYTKEQVETKFNIKIID